MSRPDTQPYAVLALRIGLGALFIAHALLKLFVYTLPGTAAFFESVGFPGAFAYPVFAIELLGGGLLLVGLFTRWAALAQLPVMAGATAVHWPNGWVFTNPNGGWEFTVFVGIACLALFLMDDDGALALSRQPAAATEPQPSEA